MELALGTVQFGLPYGIRGRQAKVPESEVRSILACAWDSGIRTLDTAAAYGDIEERLPRLADDRLFRVVSKIPAINTAGDSLAGARAAVDAAERSRRRLGALLTGLMFHRAEDVTEPGGAALFCRLAEWGLRHDVRIGVSVYDPGTCVRLYRDVGLELAQVPGSALDQRVPREIPSALPGLEIHLRSVFLQGLLLMSAEDAAARVPAASSAMLHWHEWCRSREVTPLVGALSIVRSFRSVSLIVIGVDSESQMSDIIKSWHTAKAIEAPEVDCRNPLVVNVNSWNPR
jgi:aryl-alcohol dehydrogenase-like predicted oxidoreductase